MLKYSLMYGDMLHHQTCKDTDMMLLMLPTFFAFQELLRVKSVPKSKFMGTIAAIQVVCCSCCPINRVKVLMIWWYDTMCNLMIKSFGTFLHRWFGFAVACWLQSTSYCMPGPANTWTGDCLQAGMKSRCVTSHLGQLSLPSLRAR